MCRALVYSNFFLRVNKQNGSRLLDIAHGASPSCDERLELFLDGARAQIEGHGLSFHSHEENRRDVALGDVLPFGRHLRKHIQPNEEAQVML